MGFENRKVLLFSTVKDMLESQGWSFYQIFNNEYIFKDAEGEVLAIPQHPTKPRLIYLDQLLSCTPVLRQEFIEAASLDWDLSSGKSLNNYLQFDLWLDPGDADSADIQALFSALSELNRAAGGLGLTFQKSKT
ncbi:hypothetical protein ACFL02_08160 [Planctomycetota bacterium]